MTTVLFKADTDNRKTGHIAASYTEKSTCPDACKLKNNGCYADGHPVARHWHKVGNPDERTKSHFDWDNFCLQVQALPKGKMFRHNVAGDLPGENNSIDRTKLDKLVSAAARVKGFTFTHKPVGMGPIGESAKQQLERASNSNAIKLANESGFTINLSADDMSQADYLAELNIGPVVTVVGMDAPRHMKTPEGRNVIVCPNEEDKNMTCERCRLCANSKRKAIIAFRAHGFRKHKVTARVNERVHLKVSFKKL